VYSFFLRCIVSKSTHDDAFATECQNLYGAGDFAVGMVVDVKKTRNTEPELLILRFG
jgi:hypothetical protein